MAFLVLNPTAEHAYGPLLGWSRQDQPMVLELARTRPGYAPRVEVFPWAPRTYRWPVLVMRAARVALDAFLLQLGNVRDAFLLADPDDAADHVSAVTPEPATGDGARVTFSLPTDEASAEWRFHPLASSVVVTVNGSAVGVASVDQDGRTVTLAAAPALGAAVRLWYQPLRLVRLASTPTLERPDPAAAMAGLELVEVFRDA